MSGKSRISNFTSLLSKISSSIEVNHNQPIGVYNVIYKITSTTIIKRPKGTICSHISIFQED